MSQVRLARSVRIWTTAGASSALEHSDLPNLSAHSPAPPHLYLLSTSDVCKIHISSSASSPPYRHDLANHVYTTNLCMLSRTSYTIATSSAHNDVRHPIIQGSPSIAPRMPLIRRWSSGSRVGAGLWRLLLGQLSWDWLVQAGRIGIHHTRCVVHVFTFSRIFPLRRPQTVVPLIFVT